MLRPLSWHIGRAIARHAGAGRGDALLVPLHGYRARVGDEGKDTQILRLSERERVLFVRNNKSPLPCQWHYLNA